MKKLHKIKKLFIEELETRRSTSPLFIQTMAVGEAGINSKDNGGSSSKENLANGQKAKEKMVAEKNDQLSNNSDPIKKQPFEPPYDRLTTLAIGEEGEPPKPPRAILKYALPEPIQVKYAPPGPIEKYAPPNPIQVKYAPPGPIEKYAPPDVITTAMIGEEGSSSKPDPIPVKYAPPDPGIVVPLYAVPDPRAKVTTLMIGEEGVSPKPKPKPKPGWFIRRWITFKGIKEDE